MCVCVCVCVLCVCPIMCEYYVCIQTCMCVIFLSSGRFNVKSKTCVIRAISAERLLNAATRFTEDLP